MSTIITSTERLILRLPTVADAADSLAIYSDPEVMRFIDGEEPFESIEQARESIKRGMAHYAKHAVCHWAVIVKETNLFVGHCGFNVFDSDDEIELVAHFKREFWGKGYATEAGQASLIYVRDHLSFKKAVGLIEPGNHASIRLVEKLGFDYQGEYFDEGVKLLKYEFGF